MLILNTTNNTKIASEVKVCKNILSLIRGLMFHKKLSHFESFLLDLGKERNGSIHTLFVFFPIDVIWLNKNKEVIKMQSEIKPFTLYSTSDKPSRYIIELSAGSIKTTNLKLGDVIDFIY